MDAAIKLDKRATSGSENPEVAKRTKKSPTKAQHVLLGLLTTFALVGGGAYIHGLGKQSTDDAQVEGHITNIAARTGGQVIKVLVQDNQHVQAGDALVELDKTELDAKLAVANADLAAARAQLKTAEAQLSITQTSSATNISSARSRFDLARIELQRMQKLRQDGVVSVSDYDAKKSSFDQATAALEQAEARTAKSTKNSSKEKSSSAQVDAAEAAVDVAAARVQQAEAAQKLAEVNLSYAVIKAPVSGLVSRRSVEEGQIIAAGSPLLALVPLNDVWIVANFKEDQLAEMKAGQLARIQVDTFAGKEFTGHVESLAAATGSKFALLPPDNASGNFVKVVQRVPVLIRLEKSQENSDLLRPGMSSVVTVYTGDVQQKG